MSTEARLARLRQFLLWLAAGIFVATPVELWLTEHYDSLTQLIPFGLCAAGLVVVLATLYTPQRSVLVALQVVMVVIMVGSLVGVYQHVQGNLEFALEIHPDMAGGAAWLEALKGANPLLAPGILVIASLLSLAAAYTLQESGGRQDR